MKSFSLLFSSLISFLLLAQATECTYTHLPTLIEALREAGLGCYANFLLDNPTPMMNEDDLVVFAPTNDAVGVYMDANPEPLPNTTDTIETPQLRRRSGSPAKAAANRNNMATKALSFLTSFQAAPGSGRNRGVVTATAGGGTADAKVAKPAKSAQRSKLRKRTSPVHPPPPPTDIVGTVAAGNGVITNMLEQAIKYDKGIIFPVDSFFNPTPTFLDALKASKLDYLLKIFKRLPHSRDALVHATNLTFLAPTPRAFKASGLDPWKSKPYKLQQFLDNHTIKNGFLGYTPSFEEGVCYRTVSGKGFVASFVGEDGERTRLNEALVVGEDHIVRNGVVQIIDKVLHRYGDKDGDACSEHHDGHY